MVLKAKRVEKSGGHCAVVACVFLGERRGVLLFSFVPYAGLRVIRWFRVESCCLPISLGLSVQAGEGLCVRVGALC